MKLIDVSVPLDASSRPIPDNTPFTLEAIKRIARGDSSNVSTLHMSAHAGTHVDAPRHFFDDGPGTEALPLELLIGRARVIEVDDARRHHGRGPAAIRPRRRCPRPDQDAQLAALGLAGLPRGLRRRRRVGRAPGSSSTASRSSAWITCRSSSSRTPGAPAHHILLGGGVDRHRGARSCATSSRASTRCSACPFASSASDGAPARVVLRRS